MEGQTIQIAPQNLVSAHLLCAAEDDAYIEWMELSLNDVIVANTDFGVSCWMGIVPTVGSTVAVTTTHVHRAGQDVFTARTLWAQTVTLKSAPKVDAVTFSFNPFVHIFAITLQGT